MGRGLSQASKDLIERILEVFNAEHPNSPRRVAYALFGNRAGQMAGKVGRLCGRLLDDGRLPLDFYDDSSRSYLMPYVTEDMDTLVTVNRGVPPFDPWRSQPVRVVCWSEKAVGGTLEPVLQRYSVPFLNTSGWNSRKFVMQEAERACREWIRRRLIILYVGDHDPCGLRMSEADLPRRLRRSAETFLRRERIWIGVAPEMEIRRLAITRKDFAVMKRRGFTDPMKPKDPNRGWYLQHTGLSVGVELETLPAPVLRARVEQAIVSCIHDRDAWARSEAASHAVRESWEAHVDRWPRPQISNSILDPG